jgi:hypothetical protein
VKRKEAVASGLVLVIVPLVRGLGIFKPRPEIDGKRGANGECGRDTGKIRNRPSTDRQLEWVLLDSMIARV